MIFLHLSNTPCFIYKRFCVWMECGGTNILVDYTDPKDMDDIYTTVPMHVEVIPKRAMLGSSVGGIS